MYFEQNIEFIHFPFKVLMINDGCHGDEAQILLLDERDMLTSVGLDLQSFLN